MNKALRILVILFITFYLTSCAPTSPQFSQSDVAPHDVLHKGFVDNFSGTQLDLAQWSKWVRLMGVSPYFSNGIILSTSEEKGISGIITRRYIVDDFDTEVSYEIEQWTQQEGGYASLGLTSVRWTPKTDEIYIKRSIQISSGMQIYGTGAVIRGKYSGIGNSEPTQDMKGKLRIRRSNGYVTTFYYQNGQWIVLKNFPMKFNQSIKIVLYLKNVPSKSFKYPRLRARFTNFALAIGPGANLEKTKITPPKPKQRELAKEYYLKGNSLFEQEKYWEAAIAYEKAIELEKGFAPLYYNLGVSQLKLGLNNKALNNLKKYLELRPNAKNAADVKRIIRSLEK